MLSILYEKSLGGPILRIYAEPFLKVMHTSINAMHTWIDLDNQFQFWFGTDKMIKYLSPHIPVYHYILYFQVREVKSVKWIAKTCFNLTNSVTELDCTDLSHLFAETAFTFGFLDKLCKLSCCSWFIWSRCSKWKSFEAYEHNRWDSITECLYKL